MPAPDLNPSSLTFVTASLDLPSVSLNFFIYKMGTLRSLSDSMLISSKHNARHRVDGSRHHNHGGTGLGGERVLPASLEGKACGVPAVTAQ